MNLEVITVSTPEELRTKVSELGEIEWTPFDNLPTLCCGLVSEKRRVEVDYPILKAWKEKDSSIETRTASELHRTLLRLAGLEKES